MIEQQNALIHETSPYLLQHAHNPVHWQAWSTESLAQAKKEDKPILLSIGYASCHWCHVMEKESFEDPMVAEVMNDNFVCIKVDREEMPDVDQLYMDAVQAMGLQGGWPLNVFLTPDQKPFYGGTYFPRQNWIQLLESVAVAFLQKREELEESADAFANATGESIVKKLGLQEGKTGDWNTAEADLFFQKIQGIIDWEQGGTQGAPKFPMPVIWEFLLHYAHLTQNDKAQEAVTVTLEEMARGGIYDQIGGGFARYSVDSEWFAPHFEKMLYDNGQLLTLYSRAYKVDPKPEYARIIRETVAFLEREMQHPSGGFFSGLDADSEGVEGKFYTWTASEWDNATGEEGTLWKPFYNIAEEGNWEGGRNILYTQETPEQFAQRKGLDEAETLKSLAALKENLLEVRSKRIAPARDEKVLTGWNALVIEGLCEAFQALSEEHFLEVAQKATDFILDALYREGKLHRSWKEGTLKQDAFLEDYALLIRALLSLYQSDFNPKWYEGAEKLLKTVEEHFWDEAEGYYFFTHQESHALIARKKELFDNVIPSSNGVMAHNLWTIGKLSGNTAYLQKAERMLQKIRPLLSKEPHYLMEWARLYLKMAYPSQEVAIMGEKAKEASAPLHTGFFPQVVVAASSQLTASPPLLEGRKVSSQAHLFYVCKNFACQLPVESWQEALKQLHP